MTHDESLPIESLGQELTRLAVGGMLTLGLGAFWLSAVWGASASLQWLVQSTVLWLFIWFQTARRLTLNRADPQSAIYARLGQPPDASALMADRRNRGFLFKPGQKARG